LRQPRPPSGVLGGDPKRPLFDFCLTCEEGKEVEVGGVAQAAEAGEQEHEVIVLSSDEEEDQAEVGVVEVE